MEAYEALLCDLWDESLTSDPPKNPNSVFNIFDNTNMRINSAITRNTAEDAARISGDFELNEISNNTVDKIRSNFPEYPLVQQSPRKLPPLLIPNIDNIISHDTVAGKRSAGKYVRKKDQELKEVRSTSFTSTSSSSSSSTTTTSFSSSLSTQYSSGAGEDADEPLSQSSLKVSRQSTKMSKDDIRLLKNRNERSRSENC